MRYGNDSPSLCLNENGKLFCCHMPADYCAEHEWGINNLESMLGITKYKKTEGPLDITRFQMTNSKDAEDFLHFQEEGNDVFLSVNLYKPNFNPEDWSPPSIARETLDESVLLCKVSGKWDEKGFALYVEEPEAIDCLKQLRQAILDNDFAVMIGRGGPFKNGGLNLMIVSQTPEQVKQTIQSSLESNYELNQAAEATGIYNKISSKQYYALSPSWIDSNKTEVHFWLNPTDQRNNNYGWFTVEELELWTQGRGPIPKKGNEDEDEDEDI